MIKKKEFACLFTQLHFKTKLLFHLCLFVSQTVEDKVTNMHFVILFINYR